MGESQPAKEQLALFMDLSAEEKVIFDIIHQHKSPLAIGNLTIKTNMPMSQLTMNLLNMEMQGFIRSFPGKTYCVNQIFNSLFDIRIRYSLFPVIFR
jgi:DNA processing protein